MRKIRVAVVGGGLAGLTTVYLLKRCSEAFNEALKVDVVLFEKNSSVSPEPVLLSIADTDRELLALIKVLGVELVPEASRGALPCSKLMAIMISDILQLRSKNIVRHSADWGIKQNSFLDQLDSMSIIEYFVKKAKKMDEIRSLLQMSWLSYYADDFDNLSALDALRFLSQYVCCKLTYSLKGGYDSLLHALVDSINADQQRIFLNRPISSIDSLDNQHQVFFANSDPQCFDYVVINKMHKQYYLEPGERRLMRQETQLADDLLQINRFTSVGAPASMNGAVQSAHHVVNHFLLPAIHAMLPSKDDALTPEVPIAVFTSGNDATL